MTLGRPIRVKHKYTGQEAVMTILNEEEIELLVFLSKRDYLFHGVKPASPGDFLISYPGRGMYILSPASFRYTFDIIQPEGERRMTSDNPVGAFSFDDIKREQDNILQDALERAAWPSYKATAFGNTHEELEADAFEKARKVFTVPGTVLVVAETYTILNNTSIHAPEGKALVANIQVKPVSIPRS